LSFKVHELGEPALAPIGENDRPIPMPEPDAMVMDADYEP
jgi:hypothetical protein